MKRTVGGGKSKGGSMGKLLSVLGAAVALVALAVGLAGPAWGSSGNDGQQATFRLDAVTTQQNFVDLGTPGTSLGDLIVFTGQLLQGDTEVGHQSGVCTVTSVQRNEAQGTATKRPTGEQI